MNALRVIFKDTIRSKSSRIIFFSVAFAVFVPIVLLSVSGSFMKAAEAENNRVFGRFDNVLYVTNEAELKNYEPYLNSIGKIYAYDTLDDLIIGYIDTDALRLGNIELISGEYPKTNSEVLVCNSIIYKSNSNYCVGATMTWRDKEYTISGIVNDYYAMWNKPQNASYILLPNILTSYDESKCYNALQEHYLLDNHTAFQQNMFLENERLISNVNKINHNKSRKYEIPEFVLILTALCSGLLNYYIFTFFLESERRKLSIMRFLGSSKVQTITYFTTKIILVLFASIPFGVLLGYGIAIAVIEIFNLFYSHDNFFVFSRENLIYSVTICIVMVVVSVCNTAHKVRGCSPVDLLRNPEENISKSTRSGEWNTHINNSFRLAFIELRSHVKESIIVVFLLVCSLTLFISLSLYMGVYSSRLADVEGRMPLTFDYEFLTEQFFSDVSYVDNKGELVSVKEVPEGGSIFYLMDHNKMLPNQTINEIRECTDVKSVNMYFEANDLFLLSPPSVAENPYLCGYRNDREVSDEVCSYFDISSDARGIQFFGYNEGELLEMDQYVVAGEINIDKIKLGEEIILMTPMYELVDMGNGYTAQTFITYDEYQGGQNQYKDEKYSVGDVISFAQFVSNNPTVKGYLNADQMKEYLECNIHSVKVGAIISERIAWFDSMSQPPTAYSIIGLNETMSNLGVLPTVSRARIFLKDAVTYMEFEPMIQYFQDKLSDFSFRNNAVEIHDFREFQSVIYTLCYSLILIVSLVVVTIIIIEEWITLNRNKRFYTILLLNGMTRLGLIKMLLLRSFFLAVTGGVLSLYFSLCIIKLLTGGIIKGTEHMIMLVMIPIICVVTVLLMAPLISVIKIKGRVIVDN